MLSKVKNNRIKTAKIIFLVLLLACVRAFESQLFYDPFYQYFKSDYANLAFPQINGFQLFLSMTFRYTLNTILSLTIIYVAFEDRKLIKFSLLLYVILYVILMGLFFGGIYFPLQENPFLLFYVRRFLIQPLFVILFFPAFYYQERLLKK